jgi:oligoribonuclease NrnB/cAMP/cGMP phosphodiesterase (DHH superfamily)
VRTCFYHADCPDGFGAAWAVWKAWGEEGNYLALHHDRPLEGELEGQIVVFLDMAPDLPTLRALSQRARQVIILDHHFSTRECYAAEPELTGALAERGHVIHFDLERSGAVLAWQHFHPGRTVPPLLLYVQDRDLWAEQLPQSDEVNAAISSYPRRFADWDAIALLPIEQLAREGAPLLRAQRVETERSLSFAHPVHLDGRRVEAVNERQNRSAIGHELAQRAAYRHPIGVVYRLSGERVDVSLYSVGDLDVSAIALRYGGGGHRNAAGFSVSLKEWLRDFAAKQEAGEK